MLTRILTVALAVGTLAIGTAYAQTGSTTSPTSPSTTSPSTGGSGSMSGGSSMGAGSSTTQQAQGAFDVTKYKTKAECLTAARSAKADSTLCDAVR
ncbi:MAG: hypothetical protein J0J01_31700 [Reyranella sp.]|uniref:hypothetical protein n=1 Tax=Reyranella sp. TaxID=1929291 RepID=UPI001AC65A36|nr:hypothetical protein [Reyranella sp.]MBN9091508.1 hypothetical protein [Reyranella sp.]